MATITFEIDTDIKTKFHTDCLNNNDTMTEVLRKCVDRYIAEHKPRYVQVG